MPDPTLLWNDPGHYVGPAPLRLDAPWFSGDGPTWEKPKSGFWRGASDRLLSYGYAEPTSFMGGTSIVGSRAIKNTVGENYRSQWFMPLIGLGDSWEDYPEWHEEDPEWDGAAAYEEHVTKTQSANYLAQYGVTPESAAATMNKFQFDAQLWRARHQAEINTRLEQGKKDGTLLGNLGTGALSFGAEMVLAPDTILTLPLLGAGKLVGLAGRGVEAAGAAGRARSVTAMSAAGLRVQRAGAGLSVVARDGVVYSVANSLNATRSAATIAIGVSGGLYGGITDMATQYHNAESRAAFFNDASYSDEPIQWTRTGMASLFGLAVATPMGYLAARNIAHTPAGRRLDDQTHAISAHVAGRHDAEPAATRGIADPMTLHVERRQDHANEVLNDIMASSSEQGARLIEVTQGLPRELMEKVGISSYHFGVLVRRHATKLEMERWIKESIKKGKPAKFPAKTQMESRLDLFEQELLDRWKKGDSKPEGETLGLIRESRKNRERADQLANEIAELEDEIEILELDLATLPDGSPRAALNRKRKAAYDKIIARDNEMNKILADPDKAQDYWKVIGFMARYEKWVKANFMGKRAGAPVITPTDWAKLPAETRASIMLETAEDPRSGIGGFLRIGSLGRAIDKYAKRSRRLRYLGQFGGLQQLNETQNPIVAWLTSNMNPHVTTRGFTDVDSGIAPHLSMVGTKDAAKRQTTAFIKKLEYLQKKHKGIRRTLSRAGQDFNHMVYQRAAGMMSDNQLRLRAKTLGVDEKEFVSAISEFSVEYRRFLDEFADEGVANGYLKAVDVNYIPHRWIARQIRGNREDFRTRLKASFKRYNENNRILRKDVLKAVREDLEIPDDVPLTTIDELEVMYGKQAVETYNDLLEVQTDKLTDQAILKITSTDDRSLHGGFESAPSRTLAQTIPNEVYLDPELAKYIDTDIGTTAGEYGNITGYRIKEHDIYNAWTEKFPFLQGRSFDEALDGKSVWDHFLQMAIDYQRKYPDLVSGENVAEQIALLNAGRQYISRGAGRKDLGFKEFSEVLELGSALVDHGAGGFYGMAVVPDFINVIGRFSHDHASFATNVIDFVRSMPTTVRQDLRLALGRGQDHYDAINSRHLGHSELNTEISTSMGQRVQQSVGRIKDRAMSGPNSEGTAKFSPWLGFVQAMGESGGAVVRMSGMHFLQDVLTSFATLRVEREFKTYYKAFQKAIPNLKPDMSADEFIKLMRESGFGGNHKMARTLFFDSGLHRKGVIEVIAALEQGGHLFDGPFLNLRGLQDLALKGGVEGIDNKSLRLAVDLITESVEKRVDAGALRPGVADVPVMYADHPAMPVFTKLTSFVRTANNRIVAEAADSGTRESMQSLAMFVLSDILYAATRDSVRGKDPLQELEDDPWATLAKWSINVPFTGASRNVSAGQIQQSLQQGTTVLKNALPGGVSPFSESSMRFVERHNMLSGNIWSQMALDALRED